MTKLLTIGTKWNKPPKISFGLPQNPCRLMIWTRVMGSVQSLPHTVLAATTPSPASFISIREWKRLLFLFFRRLGHMLIYPSQKHVQIENPISSFHIGKYYTFFFWLFPFFSTIAVAFSPECPPRPCRSTGSRAHSAFR